MVNIWETFLNKFSNPDNSLDQMKLIMDKLERFSMRGRADDKANFINQFYSFPAENEVERCRQMLAD